MTVTPQTNIDIEGIACFLKERQTFCIAGHVNPDGDCVGSALALATALKSMGKVCFLLIDADSSIGDDLSFLPGVSGFIPASSFHGSCDAFIAVDVPNRSRLGQSCAKVMEETSSTLTIDHHASDERMTQFAYVDPESPSTTCIVWKIASILANGLPSVEVATCAYTGLCTDTGRFMFQNVNSEAFALASQMVDAGADVPFVSKMLYQQDSLASILARALVSSSMDILCDGKAALGHIGIEEAQMIGAKPADLDSCIDVLRCLKGVSIACMLKEGEKGIRGSLRAKDETDVSELARELGGGGHRAAAGFMLEMPLPQAIPFMKSKIEEFLSTDDAEGGI